MKKDSIAILSLLILALVLLAMETKSYFPIGYFPNRWVYFLSICGVLYKLREKINIFFQNRIVQWSCIIIFLASIFSYAIIVVFYIPAFFIQFLGYERQVVFQDEKYCIMITSDVYRSGGQSNYAVFEKQKIGVKRIFQSWGPVQHQRPKVISVDGKPFLLLPGDGNRTIPLFPKK